MFKENYYIFPIFRHLDLSVTLGWQECWSARAGSVFGGHGRVLAPGGNYGSCPSAVNSDLGDVLVGVAAALRDSWVPGPGDGFRSAVATRPVGQCR